LKKSTSGYRASLLDGVRERVDGGVGEGLNDMELSGVSKLPLFDTLRSELN